MATETELALLPWEPFRAEKQLPVTPAPNWTGCYVSVQYRDALGRLSAVYCDTIAVEGTAPGP